MFQALLKSFHRSHQDLEDPGKVTLGVKEVEPLWYFGGTPHSEYL